MLGQITFRARASLCVAVLLFGSTSCSTSTRQTRSIGLEVRRVRASGCGLSTRIATGFRVDSVHVITVAHTLRGATNITFGNQVASLVAIDHRTDIAVLRFVTLEANELALFAPPSSVGTVKVVRLTDQPSGGGSASIEAVDARVTKVAPIEIDEPIDTTTYRRDGFVADLETGAIVVGDSGSPVIDDGGAVVGMVFATGRSSGKSLFAVSASEIERVRAASTDNGVVSSGPCDD